MRTPHRTRKVVASASIALACALALTGCGGGGTTAGSSSSGTATIQYWARAANEGINQTMVDAWNSSHDTQVQLTVFPDDQFVAKVAAAVSSRTPPDIVAVDSVYMPQFIRDGVLTDITDQVDALDFASALSPAHMTISTATDGTIYAVPRDVDASVLMWNKDLFERAGLDPETPPATWADIQQDAAAIAALGSDISGYYFAGACAGCNAYTMLPLVWASGGQVFDKNGAPTLDNPEVTAAFDLYRNLWTSGAVPQGAKADNGADWLTGFADGKVGIQPLGGFALAGIKEQNPNLNFGVTFLPGSTSGESAFAGGDVIGIPAGAKNPDASWDFISWTLGDEAQVNVVAKDGGLVVRSDLLDNQYTSANPEILKTNQAVALGETPSSVAYQAIVNDPNGPFETAFQAYVFDGKDSALADAQTQAMALYEQAG